MTCSQFLEEIRDEVGLCIHHLTDNGRLAIAFIRHVPDVRKKGEIRLTALEVVPSIDTLVRILSELRTPKNPTGSITLITQNASLPLVDVTLLWVVAGAGLEESALSGTLLVGRVADTLSTVLSVTVRASEVTGIVRGTDQGRMVGAIAVASSLRYLEMEEHQW